MILSRKLCFIYSLFTHSALIDLQNDKLGGVKDPWDPRMIAESAADDASVVQNSVGILGEQSLSGRIDSLPEYSPMTAVCVTGNNEVDIRFFEMRAVIFGMMAEKDAKSFGGRKLRQRNGIRKIISPVDAGGESAKCDAVERCGCVVEQNCARVGDLFDTCCIQWARGGLSPRISLVITSDLVIPD